MGYSICDKPKKKGGKKEKEKGDGRKTWVYTGYPIQEAMFESMTKNYCFLLLLQE